MTWDLSSETIFSQYRTSSILFANIGMSLVTLIWKKFVFIGAGSDTVWPSKRFRKTCQSIFPSCISRRAHLRSFKNIKLLFSTPIQANDELAGFMNTFGKRLHTGLRRNVFPQSAGPCNMFRWFCRPFLGRSLMPFFVKISWAHKNQWPFQ